MGWGLACRDLLGGGIMGVRAGFDEELVMVAPSFPTDRRSPRQKAMIPITLVPNPDSSTGVPATTLDISPLGLRIQTVVSLTTGQRIAVIFDDALEFCQVVWTKPGGSLQPGEVGVKFLKGVPTSSAGNAALTDS